MVLPGLLPPGAAHGNGSPSFPLVHPGTMRSSESGTATISFQPPSAPGGHFTRPFYRSRLQNVPKETQVLWGQECTPADDLPPHPRRGPTSRCRGVECSLRRFWGYTAGHFGWAVRCEDFLNGERVVVFFL